MPLGWVDRTALNNPSYPEFNAVYDTTHIGQNYVEMIRAFQGGTDFTVFFGFWCPDSKREVPRFLKVADLAGIPPGRIKLYSLDRSKKSSDGLTQEFKIERVPTFIVLRNGKEIGRITEFPATTIEGDLLTILASGHSN